VKGIDRTDVVLAVIDGDAPDSGTSWEMGYAYAKKKPIIGLRTDFRPGAEHGVNLMLSRSCRHLVKEYAFQEDVELVAKSVVRKLKQRKK
jgi:nucleoside 2-deoxyribosyltransferase